MAKAEISLDHEFTSTMQQLVAEAEKTYSPGGDDDADGLQSEMHTEFATINERMAGLERLFSAGLAKLAAALPDQGVLGQLQRVDENLIALRNTESVNQRLFDSLHEELQKYRDNFLRDALQKPFIRDLLGLYDDLASLSAQMKVAGKGIEGKKDVVGRWRANLENTTHSVLEILHRMDVSEIEPKEMVDRAMHRVVSYEPTDVAEEDGRIMTRVKPGFLWRDQVVRPEEVVAKRFN